MKKEKTKIIVNSNYTEQKNRLITTAADYCDAVATAGGVPIISACIPDESYVENILDGSSGLVLIGSLDIDPKIYGDEKIHRSTKLIHPRRQEFDFLLVKAALKRKLPILGICGGEQLLNVALGGSLIQHIPRRFGHTSTSRRVCFHKIRVEKGSLLHRILRKDELTVNSYHHQAVREVGKGLVVCAYSDDGRIEGIEDESRSLLAVQWHPERERENDVTKSALFGWLLAQANKYVAEQK
jgi:putative glutamine amidotransferase